MKLALHDGTQECPGCGKPITFRTGKNAEGDPTLDVSHPQPPCDQFRAFIQQLFERVSN